MLLARLLPQDSADRVADALDLAPPTIKRSTTVGPRAGLGAEHRLADEHSFTRFEMTGGHNVVSHEEAARFLEELRTYTPATALHAGTATFGSVAAAADGAGAGAGAGSTRRAPTSAAAALHEAIYAEIPSRKRIGVRDPKHASPTPERLQRLVVCVLLRHHELVSDAAAAGAALLRGDPISAMPPPLRQQLAKLWEAGYKLGRWVHSRVVDADYAATKAAEALPPEAPKPEPFERPREEARLCVPIERRALFLLRSLCPALPRDEEEERFGGFAGAQHGAVHGGHDGAYAFEEGAGAARADGGAHDGAPLLVSHHASAPNRPSSASSATALSSERRLTPLALNRSSSLIQLARVSRTSSYDRAREKLKLSGDAQVTGRMAVALDLAQDIEKRWKKLRRQAMRATGGANWHAESASQKYGALTTEVLDFLEPALLQRKATSEPAADLAALQKELRRRTGLVVQGTAALAALRGSLESPHCSVSGRRALPLLARSPP